LFEDNCRNCYYILPNNGISPEPELGNRPLGGLSTDTQSLRLKITWTQYIYLCRIDI